MILDSECVEDLDLDLDSNFVILYKFHFDSKPLHFYQELL